MNFTTVYNIHCPSLSCNLVFPSINDIKLVMKDNEELFDMLLLNKIKILPERVHMESKKYQAALHNKLVKPVK